MILFYGPAGSGKTTQAKILAEKHGWKFISAGELLRKKAEHDKELKKIIDSGNTAPTGVVNKLVFDNIDPVGGGHIIVDGYPRELEEATDLVERYGSSMIAAVVVLELSEEESVKRLKLRGRDDDDDVAIKRRFAIYHEEMIPILNHFTEHGVSIIKIDGSPSIEKISTNISAELQKRHII
jgi:adenylate kinase